MSRKKSTATSSTGSSNRRSSQDVNSTGTASLLSSSSVSPHVKLPASRGMTFETSEWQGRDVLSPPLREKTEKPGGVNRRSIETNASASPRPHPRMPSKDSRHYGNSTNQPTAPSPIARDTVNPPVYGVEKRNLNVQNGWDDGGGGGVLESRVAERSWARSLQRCLLETEAEAQKLRATLKLREQEVLRATEEVKRLREVTSSQGKRIIELEQQVSQVQLSTTHSKDENRTDVVVKPSRGGITSLDGLSIDEIKRAVRCAVEALQRIEDEFRAEKLLRFAIEEENSSLRSQLSLLRKGEGKSHSGFSNPCEEETHTFAMEFVQGPLQRFLTASIDLREKMMTPSTRRTPE